MDIEQCTPSLSQLNRMKRMSQNGVLDMIYSILEEVKPNQREMIKISASMVNHYFSKNYTERQKIELIEKLLKDWANN